MEVDNDDDDYYYSNIKYVSIYCCE